MTQQRCSDCSDRFTIRAKMLKVLVVVFTVDILISVILAYYGVSYLPDTCQRLLGDLLATP